MLAIWKSYTKQRDEAAARRLATQKENDTTKTDLDEIKVLLQTAADEQKKTNTAVRALAKRFDAVDQTLAGVNDFIAPLT